MKSGRMAGQEGLPRLSAVDAPGKLEVAPCFGRRIDHLRRRGNDLDLPHQRDILAAERTIEERLLPVAGAFEHVVANPAKRHSDIESRLCEVLEERGREGAIGASPILSRRARPRGESDQRIAAWLDSGETTAT